MAHAQKTHYTYADYLALPDDGRRYEIIEGELFVTPSPTLFHQGSLAQLYLLVNEWVRRKAGGKVFFAPIDVILADDTVVVPDLIWIAPGRKWTMTRRGVEAAPDLVVEVLSPSTSARDRGLKGRLYFQHGTREYWLVDPKARSLALRVPSPGGFSIHAEGKGETPLVSSLDPDLKVVPEDLFRPDDDIPGPR